VTVSAVSDRRGAEAPLFHGDAYFFGCE